MLSRLESAFSAAIIAAPLMMSSVSALAAPDGTPTYKDAKEAQSNLDSFCAPFQMTAHKGQEQCIQETYGQSYTFAESFYKILDVTPKNYEEKRKEWADKTDDQDYVALVGYGRTCNQLMDSVADPDSVMQYGPSTILSLPTYCVSEAIHLAKTLNLKIDFEEGARLSKHLGTLKTYYDQNPSVPKEKPFEDNSFKRRDAHYDPPSIVRFG